MMTTNISALQREIKNKTKMHCHRYTRYGTSHLQLTLRFELYESI